MNKLSLTWSDIVFSFKLGNEFSIDTQLDFVRQLNSYAKTGMSMYKAVTLTRESFAHSLGNNHIACLLCDKLLDAIQSGKGHEEVLTKYFHPNIAMCYEVLNYTTNKDAVLEVTNLVKLEKSLIKDLVVKFISPIILFFMGLGAIYFVGGTLLPRMIENFRGDELKYTFEMLLCLHGSEIIAIAFLPFILLVFSLFFICKWFLPNLVPDTYTKKMIRNRLDSTWPLSIYKSMWSIRILKLYGILKSSNLKDREIIKLIKFFTPPFCRFYLDNMVLGLSDGLQKKDYFLVGLLSKNQEIRLSPYMTHCSNDEFSNALIEASESAVIDVDLHFKSASKKYSVILLFFGAISLLAASSAIFDSSMLR